MKTEQITIKPDERTADWLRRLSAITGDTPRRIIESMLRDIRVDDEQAHEVTH